MAYWWHDWRSTSPVERVRKQYGDAIRDVGRVMESVAGDLQTLSSVLSTGVGSFYGDVAGDSSSGRFVTEFESAVGRWESALTGLIGPEGAYQVALKSLQTRLLTLQARKAILDGMAVGEDAREEEYTYGDIPF